MTDDTTKRGKMSAARRGSMHNIEALARNAIQIYLSPAVKRERAVTATYMSARLGIAATEIATAADALAYEGLIQRANVKICKVYSLQRLETA